MPQTPTYVSISSQTVYIIHCSPSILWCCHFVLSPLSLLGLSICPHANRLTQNLKNKQRIQSMSLLSVKSKEEKLLNKAINNPLYRLKWPLGCLFVYLLVLNPRFWMTKMLQSFRPLCLTDKLKNICLYPKISYFYWNNGVVVLFL